MANLWWLQSYKNAVMATNWVHENVLLSMWMRIGQNEGTGVWKFCQSTEILRLELKTSCIYCLQTPESLASTSTYQIRFDEAVCKGSTLDWHCFKYLFMTLPIVIQEKLKVEFCWSSNLQTDEGWRFLGNNE